MIDKFVFFCLFFPHRIIIYGWIYIIFCHYQQQSVVNPKKTLKCKVWQACDVTMTLMTSRVGDVVVKTLEDRRGWCTLPGCKCYSTCAIIVEFSDNICTYQISICPHQNPPFLGPAGKSIKLIVIGICLDNTAAAQRNISGCRHNCEFCEMKLLNLEDIPCCIVLSIL